MISVFGIGNPLMDVVAHVEATLIEELGTRPGTMNLVDSSTQSHLLERLGRTATLPGGSCANTMRGIAWLGGPSPGLRPVFSGGVGRDEVADRYVEGLQHLGVCPSLAAKESPTGTSVILVTPDLERTMFTHPGACREYGPLDVDHSQLSASRMLHITGYMWDTESQKQAVREAMEIARGAGCVVSFDVADPFVVERYRDEFLPWIPEAVDLLFANREELALLTGVHGSDETVVKAGAELCSHVVLKCGSDGCMVIRDGRIDREPGIVVTAVDTTAAGDSFAAGYLHGFLGGSDTAACARMANRIAAAVVTVEGCDYGQLVREEILNYQSSEGPATRQSGQ